MLYKMHDDERAINHTFLYYLPHRYRGAAEGSTSGVGGAPSPIQGPHTLRSFPYIHFTA